MLIDSIGTFNTATQIQRLLVGNFVDPQMGNVVAESYTQFRPFFTSTTVPANAIFDSLVLTLSLDYYHYGNPDATSEKISVHRLTETLVGARPYFASSSATYEPAPLATREIVVSTESLTAALEDNSDNAPNNDKTDTLQFFLKASFGQELLDLAKTNSSNFTDFLKFREIFKGFAFVKGSTNEKVLGFTTVNDNIKKFSRLILYYHFFNSTTNADEKGTIPFSLASTNGVMGFYGLRVNRAGTELNSLTVSHQDFYPASDKRYVQGGFPIVTKIDFSRFTEYMDTVQNAILNSAEIVMGPANEVDELALPSALRLQLLKTNNRFQPVGLRVDTTGFRFALLPTTDGIVMANDLNQPLALTFKDQNGEKYMSDFVTEYCQALFDNKAQASKYHTFALVATNPLYTKSVHRLILETSDISLRVYYTKPILRKNNN
ncbi:MAG TPA: hypothetical protein DCE81_06195 [Cytophagales bacterium]|nr:hypothetical protein [Cytophagales bacterium]